MKALSKLAVVLLLCAGSVFAQSTEAKFQKLLDSVYAANPNAVGILVHVEAPDKNISWTGAIGHPARETTTALDKNQPLLTASNTKTYVSATILKLAEAKKITIDQPIKSLLTEKSAKLLEADGYDLNAITVKHLLSHTSGIFDYANETYFESVNANPIHKWTRDEQIALTVSEGGPIAAPGEKFAYADVNYLLLTEIIEKYTGKPFYTAIRELLDFKKNNLNTTWFINLEKTPAGAKPLVHQYWNKYNWDSSNLDPSWDLYGGGGIVATIKDMAVFFQQLFTGKIVKDKALLERMHTPVLPREQSNYCLGLRNLMFGGTTEAWYHGGFWGTDVMYVPGVNATIAVCTLQKDSRDLNAGLSQKILELLR